MDSVLEPVLVEAAAKLHALAALLASNEVEDLVSSLRHRTKDEFFVEHDRIIPIVVLPGYGMDFLRARVQLGEFEVPFDALLDHDDVNFTATEATVQWQMSTNDGDNEGLNGDVSVEVSIQFTAPIPDEYRLCLEQIGKIKWHFSTPGSAYQSLSCGDL